jgi:hypothetical protein
MLALKVKALLLVVAVLMAALGILHPLVYLSIDAGSLSAEVPESVDPQHAD